MSTTRFICGGAVLCSLIGLSATAQSRNMVPPAAVAVAVGVKPSADTGRLLDRIYARAKQRGGGVLLQIKVLTGSSRVRPGRLAIVPTAETTLVKETRDLEEIAKKWFFSTVMPRRTSFYFGKNLARGDITACKLVGVAFSFD